MDHGWANLSILLCLVLVLTPLLTSQGPGGTARAQEYESTLTTTSEGDRNVTMVWDGIDPDKVRTVDLTMNRAWDVKDGILTIAPQPYQVGPGEDDLAYPSDVSMFIEDSEPVWGYDGIIGHLDKFEDGEGSKVITLPQNGETDIYLRLPYGAQIEDISFDINFTSGLSDLGLAIGDGELIWYRSTVEFEEALEITTAVPMNDACSGHLDFLFDSYPDIIGAGENATMYQYMHKRGSKGLEYTMKRHELPVPTPSPDILVCHIGDYDQDIDNDVAVATASGKVLVYENEGFGQLVFFDEIDMGQNRVDALAMGDSTDDGWRDIVAGYLNGDVLVSVYENENMTFMDPYTVKTGSEPINGIEVRDLGLDGLNDIVAASSDGRWWYIENDGGVGWKDAIPIRSGGSDLTSLTVVDVNWDNGLDLISGSQDGSIYVSYNLGGTFDDGWALGGGTGPMKDVVSGDLDLDGDIDILGLNADGWIYLVKNEFGFLKAASKKVQVGKDATSISLADMDNDNDLDLVVGTSDGVRILRNKLEERRVTVGEDDGGVLRDTVQAWMDDPSHGKNIMKMDLYGNVIVRIPLHFSSEQAITFKVRELDVTYDIEFDVQVKDALNSYIERNADSSDAQGRMKVPVIFLMNGDAGKVELSNIMIGYDEGFIAWIDLPEESKVVYQSNELQLSCDCTEDPSSTSKDFLYDWTVDGRPMGQGPDLKVKGKDLGGLGNHSVACKVTRLSTGETDRVSVFIQLDPNAPPVLEPSRPVEKAKVDKELVVKVQGTDADPWDATNLTYSLEEAPEGVSLDQWTGWLRWIPSKEDVGDHLITIRLTDGKEFTNATLNVIVHKAAGVISTATPFDQVIWLMVIITLVAFGMVLGGSEVGIYAMFSLIFLMYTRLKQEMVLDNFLRGRIFGHISQNPGLHFSELKRKLDLKNGTLTYHLKTLEREGLVISFPNGTHRVFYPASMKVPKDLLKLTKAQRWILEVVREKPGLSQRGLSKETGLSTSTVSRLVIELEGRGHLRVEKGRKNRIYIVEKQDN